LSPFPRRLCPPAARFFSSRGRADLSPVERFTRFPSLFLHPSVPLFSTFSPSQTPLDSIHPFTIFTVYLLFFPPPFLWRVSRQPSAWGACPQPLAPLFADRGGPLYLAVPLFLCLQPLFSFFSGGFFFCSPPRAAPTPSPSFTRAQGFFGRFAFFSLYLCRVTPTTTVGPKVFLL